MSVHKKILITGGAGFIGSKFVGKALSANGSSKIFIVDKLTYAGKTERISEAISSEKVTFLKGDICDREFVADMMTEDFDLVVNFAAETHVDKSIQSPERFERTNVRGVVMLLEAMRKQPDTRLVHISTDEVYGALNGGKRFTEKSPLLPNNPYSASKAGAEMFIRSFHATYGTETVIIRPSNNFGPYQYPEKLIPVVITRALMDKTIPVYGKGENKREWIYLDDCVDGIWKICLAGRSGGIYNLGSGHEMTNLDLVKSILRILGKPESLIKFVPDRLGHDFKYGMDSSLLETELGFKASSEFETALGKTVEWYLANKQWWKKFLNAVTL